MLRPDSRWFHSIVFGREEEEQKVKKKADMEKADTWSCISFVFATMVELAIVCYTNKPDTPGEKRKNALFGEAGRSKALRRQRQQRPDRDFPKRYQKSAQQTQLGSSNHGEEGVNSAAKWSMKGARVKGRFVGLPLGALPSGLRDFRSSTLPLRPDALHNRMNPGLSSSPGATTPTWTLKSDSENFNDEERPVVRVANNNTNHVRPHWNGLDFGEPSATSKSNNSRTPSLNVSTNGDDDFSPTVSLGTFMRILNNFRSFFTSDHIDRISMVVFPVAFTIFNGSYWWYYIMAADTTVERGFTLPVVEMVIEE
uniref:Uncharacterized protein n=1 Tax=Romanomermis culicivorax TaxID=13658 RepID=A0A915KNZ4_ROMCU